MLRQAIDDGNITRRTTVVESSSGNMGIGLSQACRYLGLRFICVVDERAQAQNLAIMRALGAEIEVVQPRGKQDPLAARIERVKQLVETIPHAYWPNQYANSANCRAHADGTATEILDAIGEPIDYVFVACSSTGTLRGLQETFAQRSPRTRIVAVDSEGSVLFGGQAGPRLLPGMGAGRVPELAEECHPFAVHRVSDRECVLGCRRLAMREAILAGASSGGVMQSILWWSRRLVRKSCVAIVHDSGTRYLDTVYSDEWVAAHCEISPAELNAARRRTTTRPPLQVREPISR
jgi:cysteine synthase A